MGQKEVEGHYSPDERSAVGKPPVIEEAHSHAANLESQNLQCFLLAEIFRILGTTAIRLE